MSPVATKDIKKQISLHEIISNQFEVSGTWANKNDKNAPDWSKTSEDSNYVKTLGQVIKNNNWETDNLKVTFHISMKKLGGSYEEADKRFNLIELDQAVFKLTSQAGQPAHNPENGWNKTEETVNFYDLLNGGNNFESKSFKYNWGDEGKWAKFESKLNTEWSNDGEILTVVWRASKAKINATKWSDGLFARVELINTDMLMTEY